MPVPVSNANYFEVLDLQPDNAGIEDIRGAYKRLALKWHPDRHTTDKEEAQQKFVEINEAYKTLLDAFERQSRHTSSQSKARHRSPTPSAASSCNESKSAGSESGTKSTQDDNEQPAEEQAQRPTHPTSPPASPKSKPQNCSSPNSGDSSSAHSKTGNRGQSPSRPTHDEQPQPSSSQFRNDSRGHAASHNSSNNSHGCSSSSHSKMNSDAQSTFSSAKHDSDAHTCHSSHAPQEAHKRHTRSRKRHTHQWSEDGDYQHRAAETSPKRSKLDEDMIDYEIINLGTPIAPLRSHGSKGQLSEDWAFPLHLTLEDIYFGTTHRYRITRTLQSESTQSVKIDVRVSPRWRNGTRVRVAGAGNQRKDGTFQDIVFIVEEEPHPRFKRVHDDLVVSVQVPWIDVRPCPRVYPSRGDCEKSVREDELYVQGFDGEEYVLSIPRTLVEGADGTRIIGAGMPIHQGGKIAGKGDLIVKWDFVFPNVEGAQRSRWQGLKKAMYWRS
ncbi:uncharacterized protein FIBRA_05743 [Fibroporia radiculosa]|uniref:J domain-containing protein n=1 Tax=Fibroporia radiculosa TaxID=599839 RepID=J4GRJ1_9APHY|nr:uncharacterized protein FIBRA_05743 [Fibroporia radiculosa]CCM03605.1 predicted protein [Fibroporia radiculosa]